MKTLVFSFCLFFLTLTTSAQDSEDYTETGRNVISIPDSQTHSTSDIACYINKYTRDDIQKVRSIYVWVITHISYDKTRPERVILNEDRNKLVTATLEKRKGVCEHFASLFIDICNKCGLKSYVIGGYTRQNGSVDKTPHAWCTVLIDKKWSLYDPTWDAGSVATNYFCVSPTVFIQMHMPFDPMFQLLDYPLSYDDFNNGRMTAGSNVKYFNYTDSLNTYEKLDPINQYVTSETRIENNGTGNSMIHTKQSQLKMEIEILNQDKDSVNYNGAVADYNSAISLFNDFLTYRNNRFKPARSGVEVQELFNKIKNHIISGYRHLDSVKQSKSILLTDTGDIEYALEMLSKKAKDQELFFQDYQNTAKEK